MKEFKIDERLNYNFIDDLKLCRVFLVNNSFFPWVILVPMRNNIVEIIDLNHDEQILLMDDISRMCLIIKTLYNPNKLNVAALGNIVPQLHIHIIARFSDDIAWPNPVFEKDKKEYNIKELELNIKKIKEAIHN